MDDLKLLYYTLELFSLRKPPLISLIISAYAII